MTSLKDQFMRPGFKDIGLPKIDPTYDAIPIVQPRECGKLDLLIDGHCIHLSEKAGRKIMEDMFKHYEGKDLKHLLGEGNEK